VSTVARTLALRAPSRADRVRVDAIVSATGVFRPDERAIALEVFDGAVQRPGADYCALGAYDERDQLIGFACYGPTPCTLGTWDLYWIAVDPGRQRHGTGRTIMDACERDMAARGGRLVVVETSSRPDYEPTRRFYQALGYQQAACVRQFYAPGDDLIIYTKPLTPSRSASRHG
jgi:ribosomal protein S18 acetylase RimI-like enzyme